MNPKNIKTLFERFKEHNPQPRSDLHWTTPFELLVAVTLSAQATDVSVNKATKTLFAIANTPQAIANLGIDGLKTHIKSIGLYNNKAKNVIGLSEQIIEKHQGEVPQQRQALEALPGVGRKTANVVLNVAFGQSTIAVDTHIFRVSNRLDLASGTTVLAVEKKLLQVVPDAYKQQAHHWLILHGRYICTARSPKCNDCHVSDLCVFKNKG